MEQIQGLLCPRCGKMQRVSIPNRMEAFQEMVGGRIETVTIAESLVLVCNEEGLLLGMEPNIHIQSVCGDFLIVGADGDEFVDLTEEQMNALERLFG